MDGATLKSSTTMMRIMTVFYSGLLSWDSRSFSLFLPVVHPRWFDKVRPTVFGIFFSRFMLIDWFGEVCHLSEVLVISVEGWRLVNVVSTST